MPIINILDKTTAELIAAGEVVERPASAIKELCENAIDAGASKITVEIQRGGSTYMRVTDDGRGIEREDVPKAFLRHATSKVKTADDLNAIGTLGFRGEALASICAVAKVELITKAENEECGTSYIIEGGQEISLNDTGCPKGTTIIVRDLFYNVPARMKFLKKDVAEGNAVAAVIEKIALSHSEIAFSFIRDGKRVINTPGDGKLISAIYSVCGKDFAKDLIPLTYTAEGVTAEGYICKPTAAKATRNMQNFFLNGRFVKSRTAMAALEEAYKGSVMVGKYPSCVINIQMELGAYDVNVHPAKTEVRFTNERPLFNCIYHGVKTALIKGDERKELFLSQHTDKTRNTFEFIQRTKPNASKEPVNNTSTPPAPIKKTEAIEEEPIIFIPKKPDFTKPIVDFADTKSNVLEDSFVTIDELKLKKDSSVQSHPVENIENELCEPNQGIDKSVNDEKTEPSTTPESEPEISPIEMIAQNTELRIIGEVFDTYIILQKDDSELIIVDKHAAHERLIYEKLKKERGKYSQMLLEPIVLSLGDREYSAITDNLNLLDGSGYEIDDFGQGKVIVRAAPQYLSEDEISDSVYEIAGYLADNGSRTVSEREDNIFHTTACKAAIKGGNRSDIKELVALVKMLIDNPDVRYCPHGRPISTVIKRRELEKGFGRIQ